MARTAAAPSPQTQWVPLEGKRKKLKKLTPREEIDRLIDWYAVNKPDMEKVMPGGVYRTAMQLNRFAKEVEKGKWEYRGWILTAAEIPPKGKEKQKIAK